MTTSGQVNDRKVIVQLEVTPRRSEVQINCEAIVDTGFEGGVALPVSLMDGVDFEPLSMIPIALADGTTRWLPTYSGVATIGKITEPVAIIALPQGSPLVGMTFLDGLRLTVNAWPGGDVIISRPGE